MAAQHLKHQSRLVLTVCNSSERLNTVHFPGNFLIITNVQNYVFTMQQTEAIHWIINITLHL